MYEFEEGFNLLLKQMKYFVTIVDCNSFTEAAERLFISQSAISQQMKVLEKEFGTNLMTRGKRTFTLTPAGEYFYAQARGILENVEEVRIKTMEIGSEEAEEARLRVGYLSNYGGQEMYQAIAKFSEIYPDIPIDIMSGTHEELYHGMLDGTIDLAFNDQRRAFSDEFVNFEMLKTDCYIEISIRNEMSKQDSIEISELKATPCILISSREQQSVESEHYKNVIGYNCPFLYAESLEEGRLMTVGNRGFLPVESVEKLPLSNPTIKRLKVLHKGKTVQRNYCVFWLKNHENYYIAEFANILHKLFMALR